MYLGKIVEHGSSRELYEHPSHPEAQMLLASAPELDPRIEKNRKEPLMIRELPSPTNPPSGCRFRTRCPLALDDCAKAMAPFQVLSPGHTAACTFAADSPRGTRSALFQQEVSAA